MRCNNCGWDNSAEGVSYCKKCHSPLSINEINNRTDKNNTPYGSNQLHYGHSLNIYTVWSLPCIIHYTIGKDELQNYRIKKYGVTKQCVEDLLKLIQNDKDYICNHSTTYICPVCGHDVVVKGCPMCFGDDYEHYCLGCHNQYLVGGTRFDRFEYTPLEALHPSPYKFAYDTMHTRCKIIADSSQKILLEYEDVILIMEDLEREYQITDYMRLCI